MKPVYLDHNATTPLDPRVRDAMLPFLGEVYGNPSSVHAAGRRARDAVEAARAEVVRLVEGTATDLVVFTSGGTEADGLGIVGAARAARARGRPPRVVTSRLEHPAVRGAVAALALEGFEVVNVPVDGAGRIDPEDVARAAAPAAALVSLALANHELGNVYDVPAFAAAAHAAGALLHCDAVQAVGKIAVSVAALGVDLLAISAHKIHGPKGAGALWVRGGVPIEPLATGGHQERGLRPGTENVAGAVGLGAAARVCHDEGLGWTAEGARLRDRLEAAALRLPDSRVHGDRDRRLATTCNVAFAGAPGELVVIALDLAGVMASTGSACTSGTVAPSPVLLGLGVPRERAAEAVRLSLGRETTAEEVARVETVLPGVVERIRAVG